MAWLLCESTSQRRQRCPWKVGLPLSVAFGASTSGLKFGPVSVIKIHFAKQKNGSGLRHEICRDYENYLQNIPSADALIMHVMAVQYLPIP